MGTIPMRNVLESQHNAEYKSIYSKQLYLSKYEHNVDI